MRTLAHVVPTTSVPTFIGLGASSQAAVSHMWHKKGQIHHLDLPPYLKTPFLESFTPHLFELFGTLPAWEKPPEADLLQLWWKVFPNEQHIDFHQSDVGKIALKLVCIHK